MNIKQAKEEIKHTVRAYLAKEEMGEYTIPAIRQRPILLIGPPGIGKTQIMEQIARECNIGLVSYTITHHTRQSAVGLPYIKEKEFQGKTYSVTEYTMSEIIASIYDKMKDSGLSEGILFIDEINCVSETLAPTMLQFLQCKTFGNQAVPPGWIIVAAGNPPEYNKSVREFDLVTLDRIRYIELEPDFTVWKEYATTIHIHPAILSYLELRPKNFYRIEEDIDGLQFITARGWEDLGNLIETYESLSIEITETIVYEFIHHMEVAQDMAAYYELYRKYADDYKIPEILAGHIHSGLFARISKAAFDERLSVVNLLSDGLMNYFMRTAKETERTDLWYAFLKDYRSNLSDATAPHICYHRLLKQKEAEFTQACQGNLLDRFQMENEKWLLNQLWQFVPDKEEIPQQAFAHARQGFDLQQEILEQAILAAGVALEQAFDFMEQAFPKGQEMVVFVTNLTVCRESASFLAAHNCERYIRYNDLLLTGSRREQILSELERDTAQFT